MAKRVPHSTRAILNTIAQLRTLEQTLKQRVKSGTPAGSIKVRAVIVDASKLIKQLEDIAGRTTSAAGLSIEEVKQQLSAESAKRRSGQLGSSDMCEEPVEKATGPDLAGVMVALYPQRSVAAAVAWAEGEPSERLHVTLTIAEDGFAERGDWGKLLTAVESVAKKHGPLVGVWGGYGKFLGDEQDVVYLSPDIPGLPEFRQKLVEAAESAGFRVKKDHGYVPHCTVAYVGKEDNPSPPTVPTTPLTFSQVHVVAGDKKIGSFKLGSRDE